MSELLYILPAQKKASGGGAFLPQGDARSYTARIKAMRSILTGVVFLVLVCPCAAKTFYFPHVVDGGGITTIITVSNLSDVAATGTLTVFNPDGTPMTLTFLTITNSTVPLALAPHSTEILTTAGTSSPLKSGYAKVETNGEQVTAIAILSYADGREATVLPSNEGSQFSLYVESSGQLDTGVALVRLTNLPVRFTLYNPLGQIEGTPKSPTWIGKKMAQFVPEIMGVSPPFRGRLVMESDGPFAVIGLRFGGTVLSMLPVSDYESFKTVFSPNGGLKAAVIQAINDATSSIDIAIDDFTATEIGDALVAAKNRGVLVRIITDAGFSGNGAHQANRLEQAGVQVKRYSTCTRGLRFLTTIRC